MFIIRWLKKNKILVLVFSVVVISIVYFMAKNAINNYNFNKSMAEIETVESEDGDTRDENQSNNKEKEDFSGNRDEIQDDGNGIDEQTTESSVSTEEIDLNFGNEESSNNLREQNVEKGKESEQNKDKIYVYITGEVNNPGVVLLNEGSRIVDAINRAGGTTSNANISKINLVYVLEDGMKVNIPNDMDLKNNSNFEYITMNSGDGGIDDYYVSSLKGNGYDEGGEISSKEDNKRFDVVNINTATQTELETLPGIGPSIALNIINYRKENGKFSSIDQIKSVSGIGDAKFEALKKYITI